MNKKIVVISMITLLALGFALGNSMTSTSIDDSVSAVYHTSVCKQVIRANGEVEDLGCNHNLLPMSGRALLQQILGGINTAATSALNMTIANCTGGGATQPNVTDTKLCGKGSSAMEYNTGQCGMGPVVATYYNFTGNVAGLPGWNITNTFTSTCNDVIVNATALYNTTTQLFAENTFTTVTLQNGDQLNVTWGIWVTGS